MTTWRIELYDHAWGGWRTGDHESASPGHKVQRAALELMETEVRQWPFKRLRLVNEQTGVVVREARGVASRS